MNMIIERGHEGDFHDIHVCEVDEFPDQEFAVVALAFGRDDTYEQAIVCPFDPDEGGQELPLFFFRTSSMEGLEYRALAQQAMAAYVKFVKREQCRRSTNGQHVLEDPSGPPRSDVTKTLATVSCRHCNVHGFVPVNIADIAWEE
jgi:hypothetical protein